MLLRKASSKRAFVPLPAEKAFCSALCPFVLTCQQVVLVGDVGVLWLIE